MSQYIGAVPESAKQEVITVNNLDSVIIEEQRILADTQAITFSNLTGLVHGGYTLRGVFQRTGTVAINLYMNVNGDATATNYNIVWLYNSNSSVSSGSSNSPYAGYVDTPGENIIVEASFDVVDDNGTKYIRYFVDTYAESEMTKHTMAYTPSVTDLTEIVLSGAGPGSAGFGAGGVFTLRRRK